MSAKTQATPALVTDYSIPEEYAAFVASDDEVGAVEQSPSKPTILPVRKPHKQMTVSIEPDQNLWFNMNCFVLHGEAEGKGGEKTYYPIVPEVAELVSESVIKVKFVPYVTIQGTLMLWPVSLKCDSKGELNSWHASALDIINEHSATGGWIRVIANQDAGGYDVRTILLPTKPKWPAIAMSKAEMVELAFKNRLIKDDNHPIIKAQLGG